MDRQQAWSEDWALTVGITSLIGGVAQLGERVLCKHEVVGSIPSASTKLRWKMLSLQVVI